MTGQIISRRLSCLLVAVVLMFSYLMLTHSPIVRAANTPFTEAFVRYDSLEAGATTTGRVCFQPTAGTINSLSIVFPTDSNPYSLAAAASWSFNTSNLDTGQTPMVHLPAAATSVSGVTLNITLTSTLAANTADLYCFNFNSSLTLPTTGGTETAPGSITSSTSAPAVIDQTNFSYSNAIISNNTVVVNAVVPPSFALALSGNTDTFASNLSTLSINSSPGNTITITTNAASGYILWAEDSNYRTVTDAGSSPANEHGALKSSTANYALANETPSSLGSASHLFAAGTEDYGLEVSDTTPGTGYGTSSVNAAYINTGSLGTYAGVLNPTFYEPIASDTGTANGNALTVKELATISGNTPAGSDYTDTIYYTGAGEF